MTIAVLMVDYLRHAKSYYGIGETSEWHRIKLAVKPIKDLYPDTFSAEFGSKQFKTVRQRLIEGGLSRNVINAHMKRIVRMFKWAAAEEKLPASVHATLKLQPSLRRGRTEASETKPVKPVSQEFVEATLPHLTAVVADMVRAQLLIGCRPGEICKLTGSMIDRNEEVWTATLGEHKTAHHGHTRTLYIGPRAQRGIEPYLLGKPNECLFRPCDSVEAKRQRISRDCVTPPSCGNARGRKSGSGLMGTKAKRKPKSQYSTNVYARAIKRAAEKSGVEHWSPDPR